MKQAKEAIDVLKTRRSVRSYKDTAIPKHVLEDIVDCARLSPSANNMQPWDFVVVTDRKALVELAALPTWGPFIRDAGACIVVCGDRGNMHLVEDGCAATQNILLAAWAHGIGSCWVAGYGKAYCAKIKQFLGIPEDEEIVSIIPLGYPAEQGAVPRKKPLKDVLHWEKY